MQIISDYTFDPVCSSPLLLRNQNMTVGTTTGMNCNPCIAPQPCVFGGYPAVSPPITGPVQLTVTGTSYLGSWYPPMVFPLPCQPLIGSTNSISIPYVSAGGSVYSHSVTQFWRSALLCPAFPYGIHFYAEFGLLSGAGAAIEIAWDDGTFIGATNNCAGSRQYGFAYLDGTSGVTMYYTVSW